MNSEEKKSAEPSSPDQNGYAQQSETLDSINDFKQADLSEIKLDLGDDIMLIQNNQVVDNFERTRSGSISAPRRSSISMYNNEDDLNLAASELTDLDELCKLVNDFEESAFNTKKRINLLDKDAQQLNILPQTLKLCYQQVYRHIHADQPDFDAGQNMENSINEIMKQTIECNKEFGQFKGEFFAINEPIINKDMTTLKIPILQQQKAKQVKQNEKIQMIELNVTQNTNALIELKERYEEFEKNIFQERFEVMTKVKEELDSKMQEIGDMNQTTKKNLEKSIAQSKQIQPQTKEQRQQLSDIQTKLQKFDRRQQKFVESFDKLKIESKAFAERYTMCDKIVGEYGPQPMHQMVKQTKQLQEFIELQVQYKKLLNKIQQLFQELQQMTQDVQEIADFVDKYTNDQKEELRNQFNTLIKQIHTKNIEVDKQIEDQIDRLASFENRILDNKISDSDQFFLNKEIQRQRNALNAIQSSCQLHRQNTDEIEAKVEFALQSIDGDDHTAVNIIQQDEIKQLQQCHKSFTKIQGFEVPKVTKNIDDLESYVIKSLKNQLNDDNKKSQNLISKIKKNYEDLQKKIDSVMTQHGSCYELLKAFNDRFDTDDLERINEIQTMEDKLKEEDDQIGFNKRQPQEDAVLTEKEKDVDLSTQSLYLQKRFIIGSINDLVKEFNNNNKMIRDSSGKTVKSEKALNELIEKNKDIQKQCEQIQSNTEDAKLFADDIIARLLQIINQDNANELAEKYQKKNKLCDDCNKIIDKCDKQQVKLGQTLAKQNEVLDDLLKKLNQFNPLNSNSVNGAGQGKEEFNNKISLQIDQANDLKTSLENDQEKLNEFNDELKDHAGPLREMGERVVLEDDEIENVKNKLEGLSEDLILFEQDVTPKQAEIADLQKAVKELLDKDILRRLQNGQETTDQLDKKIQGCEEKQNTGNKKLKYFKELLDKAIKNHGDKDPALLEKLKELKVEQAQLVADMSDPDAKVKDLKKKKNDAKKVLDDITKAPQNFSPNQIDNLLVNLDDLDDKCDALNDKIQETNDSFDKKFKDLEILLQASENKKEILQSVNEVDKEIQDDLDHIKTVLEKLPVYVQQLKTTAEEMKLDTNQSDDYHEKKDEIEEHIEELNDMEAAIEKFEEQLLVYKDQQAQLKQNINKSASIENLQKVLGTLNTQKNEVSNLLTDCLDTQEQLDDIKTDMGDCDIPKNIARRKTEQQQFSTKYERLQKELNNLKNATKKQQATDPVLKLLKEAELKLKAAEKERQEHNKLKVKELDAIQPVHCDDFTKNYEIIKKIRKFKSGIQESDSKIKGAEELLNEVHKKITEADLENSTDLLGLKSEHLNERLQESKANLQKIQRTGDEMDGNTSNKEEDDFISGIQAEMPEVFENIETTLELLKEIQKLVQDVKQTLDTEKAIELKKKVDIANENVEESEGLVSKLTSEILEWNALKKLIRRDAELEEIGHGCHDLLGDLIQEKSNTEIELQRNQEKQTESTGQDMVDEAGNKVDILEDLARLEEQMNSYVSEIYLLSKDLEKIEEEQKTIAEEFRSSNLPKALLDARKKRQESHTACKGKTHLKRPPQKLETKKIGAKADEDAASIDPFQMLSINAKCRKKIKELLDDLNESRQARKTLEQKYSKMRQEVFKIKQIKLYKPVAGDVVDEMFAGYLNKAELTIEVQRISASNYMFGTKKILAKIINGRLVIRVGGGYMNAEEFIDQYGKIEMMKMMKMEEAKEESKNEPGYGSKVSGTGHTNPKLQATGVRSSMMMNDFKNAMKEKMMQNITTYGKQTNDKSINNTPLQKTNNTKSKLSIDENSLSHGGAKQRATVDSNSNLLKSALNNLKSDLSAQTPDMVQRKTVGLRQTVSTPGIRGGKSPTTANKSSLGVNSDGQKSKIGGGALRRGTMMPAQAAAAKEVVSPNKKDKK